MSYFDLGKPDPRLVAKDKQLRELAPSEDELNEALTAGLREFRRDGREAGEREIDYWIWKFSQKEGK